MSIHRWSGALVRAAGMTAALAFLATASAAAPGAGAKAVAEDGAETTTRSEAQTELFELVATSGHGQLTVFLDRFASNAPVTGAKVEVESGNWKAIAQETGDGSYRVKAPQFAKPGRYPLQFTVQAGADADLIETTLQVAEAAEPDAAPHPWGSGVAWWIGGAVVALAALALWLKRAAQIAGRADERSVIRRAQIGG
jgi:hypothetical protein